MKKVEELKKTFDHALLKNSETAHALNSNLANHPEISGEEYNSCKEYVRLCREKGMETEEEFCGLPTAFKAAAVRRERPEARFALLAEYDALPQLGHGCGHSASGSLSLLAAFALCDMAEELNIDIDLIGTPDEELHGLKAEMVNQGVFKKYDFAMMIHMNSDVTYPALDFLALGGYRVKFHGQTAHASASPWEGRNALNAAGLTVQALDMMRQQVKPDTRISYYYVNGGEASNVIPDYAELEILLRNSKRSYLNQVVERMRNCVKGACLATDTTYEIETIGYEYSDMLQNQTGIETICSVMDELHVPYKMDDHSMMGSSDIGNVSYECPAFSPMLAISNQHFALHTQEVVDIMKSPKANEIIDLGARIMGYTVLEIMSDPQKLTKIKEEFSKGKEDYNE